MAIHPDADTRVMDLNDKYWEMVLKQNMASKASNIAVMKNI